MNPASSHTTYWPLQRQSPIGPTRSPHLWHGAVPPPYEYARRAWAHAPAALLPPQPSLVRPLARRLQPELRAYAAIRQARHAPHPRRGTESGRCAAGLSRPHVEAPPPRRHLDQACSACPSSAQARARVQAQARLGLRLPSARARRQLGSAPAQLGPGLGLRAPPAGRLGLGRAALPGPRPGQLGLGQLAQWHA